MPDVTDMELTREYADHNSETAFAELVRRHINLVYSVALRYVGNSPDAQDVTQAVFIILAKKAVHLRHRTTLTGWLYETTRFTARQLLRTRTRQHAREQEAYMRTTLNDPHAQDVWRQLAPYLEEAMTRLNEKERALVALRFFENKTTAETAALLGIQEWAARKRAERAMEKLRRFFAKRGIASTTEALAGAIAANSIQAAPATLAKGITALAFTKGIAASAPTLTLIKGSLKIMAWTKTKTALVASVVLLLTAGTTTVIIREMHPSGPVPRTTPATATIQGQLFGPGQLVDAGNTTPEAAWETRYWARSVGDYQAVMALTDPQAIAGAEAWMRDEATFHARSKTQFASFKGFQLLARKTLADDRIELKYQFTFEAEAPQQTKIVEMVKANGAWRCASTRAYDADWDTGSQPEPQP